MVRHDSGNDPSPHGSDDDASPGGPLATPQTPEGQQAANDEGEEA
jgi:hypothetical protein